MGVTGLWRLIEPAGKPVPVETLENKVLAVDISIWLHQMVKGYQDAKGAPIANAHLMGLFQRLCKLLYFRIKPIFVFDGAFPDLKKETIAKRQDSKAKYNSESERLKRELALILSKKTAIGNLLGKQISPKKINNVAQSDADDIFKLPALPQREEESESESEDEQNSSGSVIDLHSVELESDKFKNLPVKEKYDLLIELKETRKMNSWGKLHELPKQSDNFSDFQMQRLLKRRKVQECLQETEKEMGDGGMSLTELESLLNEEGIDTKIETLPTRRIASNNNTRFILLSNVKQALAEAKKKEEENKASTSKTEEVQGMVPIEPPKKDELDDDLEKAIKMSLECVSEVDVSVNTSKTDDSWTSCLTDFDYSDSEEDEGFDQPEMSSAKAYIMQYSDFTNRAIKKLVNGRKIIEKNKSKIPKINEVLDELNKEKSVILDRINVSSDDESKKDKDTANLQNDETGNDNVSIETTETYKIFENEINHGDPFIKNMATTLSDTTNYEEIKIEHQVNENEESSSIESNITKPVESPIKELPMDVSELSVICIDYKDPQDMIILDSSIEGDKTQQTDSTSNTFDSDSSVDDDFENVGEIESKSNKTVVQVTLNTDIVPDNDDIFADVFTNHEQRFLRHVDDTENNKQIEILNVVSNIKQVDNFSASDNNTLPDNIAEKRVQEKVVDVIIQDKIDQNILVSSISHITEESESETVPFIKHSTSNNNSLNKNPSNNETATIQKEPISTEQLNSMAEEIQVVEDNLIQEKGRLDRVGRNITEQMTKEAQELLQLFGIPYIVAPMEAEAQCAFLESANLTDGTITDDSDIWLFGGRTVYKNFFNQKKHVLQFLADRIEKSFNLTREKLILLALLVGSDYTTGVTGVGPVTALEILANFPFNKKQLNESAQKSRHTEMVNGLQEFKRWVKSGKRTDNTSLKKKLKNVNLTEDFPSVRVVQAYLEPNVEKSDEKFSWGELDITILRDYTRAKFGWSQNKLDEIIKPVLKRITERKTQKNMEDYFKRKIEFESLEDQMSKRVKAAVQRMGPSLDVPTDELILTEQIPKGVGKRKLARSKSEGIQNNNSEAGPSRGKKKKGCEESVLKKHGVKVVTQLVDGKSTIDIKIPKSDRFQEMIPQREKDKKHLLENKLKAIEVFRKTNIDRKKKTVRRKPIQPKEDAELSESSDTN